MIDTSYRVRGRRSTGKQPRAFTKVYEAKAATQAVLDILYAADSTQQQSPCLVRNSAVSVSKDYLALPVQPAFGLNYLSNSWRFHLAGK